MTIKEFRVSKKLSQAELAQALGISVSSERSYEYGIRQPSEKVLAKIVEVYGVDLNAKAEDKPKKPGRKKKAAPAAEAKPAKTDRKKKAKPEEETVEKKPARRAKKAAPAIVIQSAMGGSITAEEILARVGEAETIYIRVDENKAYWVKGETSGSVDLW